MAPEGLAGASSTGAEAPLTAAKAKKPPSLPAAAQLGGPVARAKAGNTFEALRSALIKADQNVIKHRGKHTEAGALWEREQQSLGPPEGRTFKKAEAKAHLQLGLLHRQQLLIFA